MFAGLLQSIHNMYIHAFLYMHVREYAHCIIHTIVSPFCYYILYISIFNRSFVLSSTTELNSFILSLKKVTQLNSESQYFHNLIYLIWNSADIQHNIVIHVSATIVIVCFHYVVSAIVLWYLFKMKYKIWMKKIPLEG